MGEGIKYPSPLALSLAEHPRHRLADLRRRLDDVDAGRGHGLHLLAAVPSPPEMMAPAWPMRRPGGAVCPAMKPTTGFLTWSLMNSRRGLFGRAADLADHDDRLGLRVVVEQLAARRCGWCR